MLSLSCHDRKTQEAEEDLGLLQTLSLAPSLIWGTEPKALSLGVYRVWPVESSAHGRLGEEEAGYIPLPEDTLQILRTTLLG